MSTPYPPQHPRRLERSRSNRFLGGVCGGLATYLNMDPTLVRILTVLISLFTGVPVILYLIALFVIPEEGTQPGGSGYPPVAPPQHQYGQSAYGGYGSQPSASPYPSPAPQAAPQPATDPVWGGAGAPWEQPRAAASSPVSSPEPEPAETATEAPVPTEPEPDRREDRPQA